MLSLIDKIKWELNYYILFLRERYAVRKATELVKNKISREEYKKERMRIYFAPERPKTYSVLFKICSILNYKILHGNQKDGVDIYFRVQDNTYADRVLSEDMAKRKCMNIACTNISKKYVEEKFYEVFGYSLDINPLYYRGQIIKKSNKNALHNGEILNAPIPSSQFEETLVYEKLVDNRFNDKLILDYRTPVFGEKIPFVYRKYRSVDHRFSSSNVRAELASPEEIYSDYEIRQIFKFTRSIGMDYGELDILRDKTDGRIYIVDANNTPGGIPKELTDEDRTRALYLYSMAFRDLAHQFGVS